MAEDKKSGAANDLAASTITSKPSKASKEAQKGKGLYDFTFNVDHGTRTKGEVVQMHKSTALALQAHKIGEIGEKVKFVEKNQKS